MIYSQRDSKWANNRLGWGDTNKTTIGSHGCTITSLAMLAGIDPAEVNKRLIEVKGYASQKDTPKTFNFIIWSKIQEAIPWLKWEWRGYAYENDKVSQNLPCLVEVDASRIGAPTHWVLYIGNQKMYDPWTGVEKATNYYPPKGYSIIKKIGEPPEEDMSNELETCMADRAKFWKERDESRAEVEALNTQIAGYKSRITDLGNQLGTVQAEVKNREEQVSRLNGEIARLGEQIVLLDTQLKNVGEDLRLMAISKGDLEIENGKLKVQIDTLKLQAEQGAITLTFSDLIKLILQQKITIKK